MADAADVEGDALLGGDDALLGGDDAMLGVEHVAGVDLDPLAGVPPREVIELSGYTRESVRTLARSNGIAPR